MIHRLTTLHKIARSALGSGSSRYRTPRRLQRIHFHGNEESRSDSSTCSEAGRDSSLRSE